MSDETGAGAVPQDTLIDGFTKDEWDAVARTLDSCNLSGFGAVLKMLAPDFQEANRQLFSSADPSLQFELHEAIGFLKFANRLADLGNRARYVSARGVSPDAAMRDTPL